MSATGTPACMCCNTKARSLYLNLGTISGQTLRICPEGKLVPTHRVVARGHAFPDHALRRPMRAEEGTDLTHRERNPLLRLLPRNHAHFRLPRPPRRPPRA